MSLLVFIPLAPCALRKPYFVSNHLDYHNFVSAHLLITVSVLQIPNIRMVEVLGQILGLALSATAEAATETTAAEVAASQEAAHAEQCLQICHGDRDGDITTRTVAELEQKLNVTFMRRAELK